MKHADLMTSVAQHARTQPGAIALCGSNGLTLTYAQLDDAVAKLSAHLVRCDIRCIALIADKVFEDFVLEVDLLVSERVARQLPEAWRSLGSHTLRGVGDKMELFTLP